MILSTVDVDVDAVVPACATVAAVVPAAIVVVVAPPVEEEELVVDPKLKTNPSGVELLAEAEELATSGGVS
jgi:hypothetical protein